MYTVSSGRYSGQPVIDTAGESLLLLLPFYLKFFHISDIRLTGESNVLWSTLMANWQGP